MKVVGRGPLWALQRGEYEACADHWWTNFLYVNNLVPFHGAASCYGVSWYLPNDMQFFLLLPWLVVLHARAPRATYGAIAAACAASVAYSLWAAKAYGWSFVSFDAGEQAYFADFYIRPWTRIPPYLVGVAAALLARDRADRAAAAKDRGARAEKATTFFDGGRAALVAGVALVVVITFGSYRFYQTIPSSPAQWENHVFLALTKPAWAVALSLIVAACVDGRGSLVASFLSLPAFGPLAKLTFAAYLIHPAVLDVLLKATPGNTRVVFSEIWWYVTFLGVSCVVLIFSFLVHLFVEQPLVNLEKLLLRNESKPRSDAPPPLLSAPGAAAV